MHLCNKIRVRAQDYRATIRAKPKISLRETRVDLKGKTEIKANKLSTYKEGILFHWKIMHREITSVTKELEIRAHLTNPHL